MLQIKKIDSDEKNYINQIVQIHLDTFEGFFLTFMGRGFLTQMYMSYCVHDSSGLYVATEQDEPVGFLAYSDDMSGLYKFMIKKKLIAFAWYSLGAFLRKPKVFLRLIRAFLKPGESKRQENYVELSSIGVKPTAKSNGIGSRLIEELIRETNFEKNAYIALETDAEQNDGANHFYQKNGFILTRSFITHEGRKMNEYRYYRKELPPA